MALYESNDTVPNVIFHHEMIYDSALPQTQISTIIQEKGKLSIQTKFAAED